MDDGTFKSYEICRRIAGENGDCGVKALASSCNVEYATALRLLRILGRPARKGTMFTYLRVAVGMLGKRMIGCDTDGINGMKLHPKPYTARTVRTIPSDPWFASGRFIVLVCGAKHVLGVVDGKPIDWTEGGAHRIVAAWQVI